jgi:hypothetical protein
VILLDTNVVSEIYKGSRGTAPKVAAWYARQNQLELYVCAPAMAELRFGAVRHDPGARRDALDILYAAVRTEFRNRIWSFNLRAAEAFADITVARQRAGKPITFFDAQIAAVARTRGATLATRDVAGFDGLGLRLENPWA